MGSSKLRDRNLRNVRHDGRADEASRHSGQNLGGKKGLPVFGNYFNDDSLYNPLDQYLILIRRLPAKLTRSIKNVKVYMLGRRPNRSAVIGDSI